jgi:PKD repeat protein
LFAVTCTYNPSNGDVSAFDGSLYGTCAAPGFYNLTLLSGHRIYLTDGPKPGKKADMPRQFLVFILLAALGGIVFLAPGCDKLVTETIEVTTAGNPTAEFSISPDSGCIPLLVHFDDASSGPVIRWIWNFGDGAYDTILADSGDISHTYAQPGTYTVTLSVFDNIDGSDAETKKRAVIVGHNIDSVTLSDTLGCPGEEFTFTAHNPYGVATWRWAFGDGSAALTDSSLVQTHVYDEAGIYEFKLTVTGECGQKILVDTVHILNCAAPYFKAVPEEGCGTFNVNFLDSSGPAIDSTGGNYDTVGNIVHWHWDFGNGSKLEYDLQPQTIEAQYTQVDTYPVTLSVTTDSGGVTSYTDTIIAYPVLKANFTAEPLSSCQIPGRQFVVAFKRQAAGDTAWIWDFGDGDSAFEQNVYHAYTAPGSYSVTLTVLSVCGADDTTRSNLIQFIDDLSTPVFSYSLAQLNDTEYVATYVDESPEAVFFSRFWNLGAAPYPTGDTVVDTLPASYTDTVRLTHFNECDSVWADSEIIVP